MKGGGCPKLARASLATQQLVCVLLPSLALLLLKGEGHQNRAPGLLEPRVFLSRVFGASTRAP